jgi:signal transduction histidine kinase
MGVAMDSPIAVARTSTRLRIRRRRFFKMRWWLASAFGIVALTTAVVVVLVVGARAEQSFRNSAVELAVGNTVVVAEGIAQAETREEMRAALRPTAVARAMNLFVVDADGRVVASASPGGLSLGAVPRHRVALETALSGGRFIRASSDGSSTLVALPVLGVHRRAVVSYTARPEVRKQLGIVRDETATAALWATLIGGAVGFVVAQLIAMRLRRIATTARSIEGGDFETPVVDRFPDELGGLAASIDSMRRSLRDSFTTLAADRDRLDALLARLTEGVVAVQPNGTVEFANDAARRILDAPLQPGDALPDPWPDLSLPNLVQTLVAREARPVQLEVRPTPDTLYVVAGVPAVEGADSVALVVVDLSQRERHERAQREFVTHASHELRNPVAAIMTSIELLQAGAKRDPEAREAFLSHIEEEARRLGRLTRALLVLSRAQTTDGGTHPTAIRLGELLAEVARTMKPAPTVAVHVDADPDAEVVADRDVLEQALAAVAANAAKYTRDGEIVLRGAVDGDVTLDVADTGPGIDPEHAESVFDRFYRVGDPDRDGFGLGLAIAEESVKLLGGTIGIVETPGGGTTVRIRLPKGGPA